MTPINVSSFFCDPLKLEDQKAVTSLKIDRAEGTICNVRRTLLLTPGGLGLAVGPGQSPASLEKDLNGLKEEDTGRPVPRDYLKLTSFSILFNI